MLHQAQNWVTAGNPWAVGWADLFYGPQFSALANSPAGGYGNRKLGWEILPNY